MKFKILYILSIVLSFALKTSAQNEYSNQLYILADKLNTFEKEKLVKKQVSVSFSTEKLNLTKDFHRLGEEVMSQALSGNIGKKLSDNISLTTDLAVAGLNFLELYFKYKDEVYKINYDRIKTVFVSVYQNCLWLLWLR